MEIIAYNYDISGSRRAYKSDRNDEMSTRYAIIANNPLGTINDTKNDMFYGALNLMIPGLIKRYLGKRIGFITPMQNQGGDPILSATYIKAIKEVCAIYSIPVLNMWETGGLRPRIAEVNAAFFVAGLHPNNAGQKIMARRIESFIETL
ncbi:SGNH/GDSL hydrolase family protein [Bacillus mycoides]|uniref:hypothetical protein n=1 Tax=Bacillus mycoides TaxID=1405 RepID=UPI001C00C42A|nr:hypothetical protein [Bacillus mycoides]QWG87089.1 hypothetical protein EXW61_28225 [Bacillus mycoides]